MFKKLIAALTEIRHQQIRANDLAEERNTFLRQIEVRAERANEVELQRVEVGRDLIDSWKQASVEMGLWRAEVAELQCKLDAHVALKRHSRGPRVEESEHSDFDKTHNIPAAEVGQ